MQSIFLGDSFDIVKRFWAETLKPVAPLYAHPHYIPEALVPLYQKATTIPIVDLGAPPRGKYGVFLDPDSGIPLPTGRARPLPIHASLNRIVETMEHLAPEYMVCTDQNHRRGATEAECIRRRTKLEHLHKEGIFAFYYVASAPFLFAAKSTAALRSVHGRLEGAGIPAHRFQFLTSRCEADAVG